MIAVRAKLAMYSFHGCCEHLVAGGLSKLRLVRCPRKGIMPMIVHRTIPRSGLNEPVAKTKLLQDGPNELPRHNQRIELRIIQEVLSEPMLALLIIGFVFYFELGDVKEAIMLGFACLSVFIWRLAFGRQRDAAAQGQFAGRAP